jgi:hypothetical protein
MTDVPALADVQEQAAPTVGRTAMQLRLSTPPEPEWLIPGMLGLGMVTELNGREKIGKGWFESYLIGALERGTPTFFGPGREKPTKALIYSEEPEVSMVQKFESFDISQAYVVWQWELAQLSWPAKIEWLVTHAVEMELDLIFIDNISAATGTDDEAGVELARKVEPLARKAKEHQLAVLYDRHQRKTAGKVEDLARGGTALAGAVDQIVAMSKGTERERKLDSWGRLWGHLWNRTVELTEEHDDYVDLGEGDWKDARTLEKDEWTVAEFAQAINQSPESARTYLEGSPLVMKRRQKRGNAYVYDVIRETAPALD